MTEHQAITIQQALDLALEHHQAGELPKAENIYQQILQEDPKQPVALHLLGVIAHQVGKHEIAFDFISEAIAIRPDDSEPYNNLGLVLYGLGRRDEAEISYNKAISIKPDYFEAHYNLSNALREQGKLDEAMLYYNKVLNIEPNCAEAHFYLGLIFETLGQSNKSLASYNKAITIKPDYAEAHYNIGNLFRENGQFDVSVVSYNKAISIKPDFGSAYYNLGIAYHELRNFDRAVENYKNAISINLDYADAYYNLGNALQELEDFDEAVSSYNKAIAIKPGFSKAHNNLGNVHDLLGKTNRAVSSYNKAIAINPSFSKAHNNLGNAMFKLGKLDEAVSSYNKAITINPDYYEAHSNLGVALKDLGMLDGALTCYNKALKLKPDFVSAHSNLVNLETYRFSVASETYKKSCQFGKVAARNSMPISNHSNYPDPERRLKIGLVSGDFCHHPIGYLILNIFTKINTKSIQLNVYSTSLLEDNFTDKIKLYISKWRRVANINDEQLAEIIVADGIDILIDLSGHSDGNRLPLFAWKPAPVQVTWIGSNATTGVKEIDYILCDQWTILKAEEKYFVEKPLRLPNTWLCFTPPEFNIEVGRLPALNNGFITFGCFNNLTKVNKTVVQCWSNVLKKIPDSKLLLKTFQLNNTSVRESTLVSFEKYGISSERLLLEGSSSRAELLKSYQNVDIALDPFPYTGGVSSMEALWMGPCFIGKWRKIYFLWIWLSHGRKYS